MINYLNRFYQYSFHWHEDKLITEKEKSSIQHYIDNKKKEIRSKKTNWLKTLVIILYVMSFTLIVAGIIYFFASNWKGFNRFTKLGIIFSSIFLFYTAGLVIYFVNKKLDILYKLFTFCGTLLFGTAVALIAQIYHMPANSARFFFIWFVPAFIFSFLMNFTPYYVLSLLLINLSGWFFFFPNSQFWNNKYMDSILTSFTVLFLINFVPFLLKLFVKKLTDHTKSNLIIYMSYVLIHLYLYWLSYKFVSERYVAFINIFYIAFLIGGIYYFSQKRYNPFMIYYSLVISIFYFIGKYIEIVIIYTDKFDSKELIFWYMLIGGIILTPVLILASNFIMKKIGGGKNEK